MNAGNLKRMRILENTGNERESTRQKVKLIIVGHHLPWNLKEAGKFSANRSQVMVFNIMSFMKMATVKVLLPCRTHMRKNSV